MVNQVAKAQYLMFLVDNKSATSMKHLFNKFHNDPLGINQIYAWHEQFSETGCLFIGNSRSRLKVSEETDEQVRSMYVRSMYVYAAQESQQSGLYETLVSCTPQFERFYRNDYL
jgi:hypothetical protein